MKKGNLKLRRNISIIVLSLLFTMMFGSICHASGEGSAAKSGNYCQVVGAFVLSNTNSTKIVGSAYVQNLYGSTVYTALSVRTYDSRGNLIDTYNYSRQVSNKGKLYSDTITTNKSYTVKSTGSVYRGTTSASGQLESVSITIN